MLWINRAQPNAWATPVIKLFQDVFPMARLSRRRVRFKMVAQDAPRRYDQSATTGRLVLHSQGYK